MSRDAARLGFVDDARGIAVVLMILWHTVDGWIRPGLKVGPGFEILRCFGGLAAPTFLTLAGAGATLKLCADASKKRPTRVSVRELAARGLHVLVTGYALRVFMWMVDGSAVLEMEYAPAWSLLVIGLGAMLHGLTRVGAGAPKGLVLTVVGVGAYAAGLVVLERILPEEVMRIARVDVLQAIGASLTLVALAEPVLALSKRPGLALVLGVAIASASDFVDARLPGVLPTPVAAYFGHWNTDVGPTIAMFPLFPWLGYALVGAAIGTIWFRGAMAGRTTETVFAILCLGAIAGCLTNENVSYTFRFVRAFPSLVRTVRMFHKIGFAMTITGLSYVVTQVLGRFPLRSLGKTSMLIYWVHLELVYGVCGRGLTRSLGYAAWAGSFLLLTLVMAGLAHLRLHPPTLRFATRATADATPRPDPPIG